MSMTGLPRFLNAYGFYVSLVDGSAIRLPLFLLAYLYYPRAREKAIDCEFVAFASNCV